MKTTTLSSKWNRGWALLMMLGGVLGMALTNGDVVQYGIIVMLGMIFYCTELRHKETMDYLTQNANKG